MILTIDVNYVKTIDTAMLKYCMYQSKEEILRQGMLNQRIIPFNYPIYIAPNDEDVQRMYFDVYKILPDWIEERDRYLKGNDPEEVLHSYNIILDHYGDGIVKQFFPEDIKIIEADILKGINDILNYFEEDTAIIQIWKDELFPSLDNPNQYVSAGNHMGETILNVLKENYEVIDQSEPEGRIYRVTIKKKEGEKK